MVKKALMLIVMATLTGCATTGSLCPVGPFIADAGASTRWTAGEKQQLATLNNSGERLCGWRAPS